MNEFEISVGSCFALRLLQPGLDVRQSRVSGAGLGLFTTQRFDIGDVLCTYYGEVHQTASALHLPDKSYLMRLGPQVYVDALNTPWCLARYINDCRNAVGYSVEFRKEPERGIASVVATRSIEAGYEVYADYGRWYWASLPSSRLTLRDLVLERLEVEGKQDTD